jgi:hypothetical protein
MSSIFRPLELTNPLPNAVFSLLLAHYSTRWDSLGRSFYLSKYDASEVAYSMSAYVRITDDQGGIHCSFVMGKCRDSPIRPTIPRLELLASVMAVRLSNLIRSEFDWKFDNIIFWTDSTTVLQYIYNESRRFHCFVATRLQEIHELTKPNQWRFVPGKLNPADDGSRGLPIEVFKAKCR